MNVICLEPHADDAVLFSCWNLIRYRPFLITVFESHRMANRNYPGGAVTHTRREFESRQAATLLDIPWEQWPFPDSSPNPTLIADRITDLKCDLLIAPAVEEGGHLDHNLVGSLAQIHGCDVIQYTTYTRSGGRSTSAREVPFEPEWPVTKLRALACYRSQIAHPATAPWFVDHGLREWVA